VLAERYGASLAPDLVVVFFGWNDHWRARGAIDAEKRIDARWESLYRRVKLLQLARKWFGGPEAPPLDATRVPPEQFAENLRAIAESFGRAGAKLLFVTAPTTHDRAVPDYLVERGFVGSKEEALAQHRAYAQIVREVAAASGAALLDLERALSEDARRERWFLEDGIHFTEEGRAAVAELCARRVSELALLR
jgi:lysophospholipase L1-like esterase